MILGITVLLTMVVFLQLLGDSLPPSDVTPLLGMSFYCVLLLLNEHYITFKRTLITFSNLNKWSMGRKCDFPSVNLNTTQIQFNYFWRAQQTGRNTTLNNTIFVYIHPNVSNYFTGNYFACSIVMVSITVIVCVISLKLHHTTTENAKEMPRLVSSLEITFNFILKVTKGNNVYRENEGEGKVYLK